MKIAVKIPEMGESVVEATIGHLFKTSGALVHAEEELLEIETAKVNQVLYAPATGQLQLTVKQGDVVKVGQTIGSIEDSVSVPTVAPAPPPPAPLAPSVPENPLRKKMSPLRRTIAERLVAVKNQTAMLTTFNELDLSAVLRIRTAEQENFQKTQGVKLGLMSFFVKATVLALKAFPELNARIEGDEIVYHATQDIGIAVGTDKGLFVPVLRNAAALSYADIEKQLKTFGEQAKAGHLSLEDLQGGTFTITNGGVYGSLFSTPILNPPQSGILGMHNIVKRPVVVDDQIVIRPMMYLALSYDHRIVDGKEAIAFLMHIKKGLEELTSI